MKVLSKDKLPEFLAALQQDFNVYVPAMTGKNSRFVLYSEGVTPWFDRNTYLSPKGAFFPHAETMYKFKTKGTNVEISGVENDGQPILLFGVRSCDVAGIDCLDRVFLEGKFEDEFYKARRESALIFALACSSHNDTCFCPSMGLDPQKAEKCDVQVYDCGDSFAFDGKSEAGNAALQKAAALLSEKADPAIVPVADFAISVEMDGVAEKLETMFEHELWGDVAGKCIGCSTCSYICPTCYCFDIANRAFGEEGQKLRCWDSCMADNYALMAGGHNPRPSKKERVRNRVMDKLLYNVQRHGRTYCVGCGRCVAKCPVNLDITTIIRQIKEAE